MALEYSGKGRLTIFGLLWDWQVGSLVTVAYTSMGQFGDTAVLGILPTDKEGEPGDLFAVAGRHGSIGEWKGTHEQRCGCWLIMIGYGALVVPAPDTLVVPDVEWSMIGARRVSLASSYAGHEHVVAGRMSLADKDLEERARGLSLVS